MGNVCVSDFRDEVYALKESMRRDWPACINNDERVFLMKSLLSQAKYLESLECKTAKAVDLEKRASALDSFASFVGDNFVIWCKARFENGEINAGVFREITGQCPSNISLRVVGGGA